MVAVHPRAGQTGAGGMSSIPARMLNYEGWQGKTQRNATM